MLTWFSRKLNQNKRRQDAKVPKWTPAKRQIRCLAHIINLATQAVISTYSKTPHVDTETSPDDLNSTLNDLANVTATVERDEIGVVCVLAVKARSSAKRTALVKQLQEKDGVKIPLNLLLDMKVRWSSTLAMLKRAYDLHEYLTDFVLKMSLDEPNAEKRRALRELCITPEEWQRVHTFIKILSHADAAQHSFSSETNPTLAHALPSLEKLNKTWTALAGKDKYSRYHDAINDGLTKISSYYNKASNVDAYLVCMHPSMKTEVYRKRWAEGLDMDVREKIEKLFKERWRALNPTSPPPPSRPLRNQGSQSRYDLDISDDESGTPNTPSPPLMPHPSATPWLREMNSYLDGHDELEEGQSVVTWWGIHSRRLPTWASLARDYLAIMASSVSSERAFSAAGILISKRRNSLKADIVEALSILKSFLDHDMIFRDQDVTSAWEFENEVEEDDSDPLWVDEDASDNDDDDFVVE
ncbi:hypothetical protein D9611_014615 [Ephemerocybe angulata]|uniref:HAT C-terminal dimerisation domain-containing protein n=1 Tax=Ephemerocybe angulata TaxID=980116 RepID=A0A8H5CD15_9AGAR|nr:hypothetical protein D9611_014615 [Tulosesus angulatus]